MRAAFILATILPIVLAQQGVEMDQMNKRQGLIPGILGDDESSSAASTSSARVTSSSREPPISSVSSRESSARISAASTSSISGTSVSSASGNSTASISGSQASITRTSNITSSASSTSAGVPSSASQNITTTVDQDGITKIVTYTYTPPPSSAAAVSSSAPSASASTTPESPAISTGAIIGISVAVGLVVLSLIGCAIWRMKRRGGDEDEAIRWPELNRHGDSDAHHALPARVTGGHGIATSPLERSLSNSSEVYMSQHSAGPVTVPMALNGSNFGAASTLDYPSSYGHEYPGTYDYKQSNFAQPLAQNQAYDHDDYSTYPPPVGAQLSPGQGGAGAGLYESDSEGDHGRLAANVNPPVYRL